MLQSLLRLGSVGYGIGHCTSGQALLVAKKATIMVEVWWLLPHTGNTVGQWSTTINTRRVATSLAPNWDWCCPGGLRSIDDICRATCMRDVHTLVTSSPTESTILSLWKAKGGFRPFFLHCMHTPCMFRFSAHFAPFLLIIKFRCRNMEAMKTFLSKMHHFWYIWAFTYHKKCF